MKQGKKFSRLLSLLLAVVMMIIMMPATAWAGEENGAVTVGFMAVDCLDGEIEYMRKELTVTPGLAKQYLGGEYGVTQYTSFEVGENDVTPVDVLVAAHIEEYGETFTNSPLGYIRGDGLGYVTKMFGSESEITYTANGIMPYTTTDDFGNTGYAINQYIVQEDDEITFYRMNYYSVPANVYASFDEVEAEIGVGENLTLKLGYYNAMDYTTEPYPAANAEIWTLDENGNFVKQLESTKTNANGEVTISFDTTGTYYLTCKGNITYMADNDWDGIEEETAGALSPAYCKVTVTGGETQNTAPAIKGEASATVAREAGSAYELDLSTIFEDADGDALTYYAKVGEGEYSQVEDGNYSYTPSAAGTYTLTFKANDGTADSAEYVVTLTVKSAGTDPTTVFSGNWFSNASVNITKVVLKGSSVIETSWNGNECEVTMSSNTPKDAEITFDISFAAGGQPQQWQGLWSALTVTLNDMTVAKPSSPNNAGTATVNLVNGKLDVVMAAATTGYSGTKTFKLKVEDGHVHDYGDWEKVDDNNHKKTCTSSEGDCLAPTITEAHKWDSGVEEAVTEGGVMVATKTTYTCGDCGATKVTQNASASILTVTVPSGAIPQIYRQDNYYKYTEYEALTSSENQNGTLTYYFSTDTKDGGTWSYRVSKEGSLTKAGYIAWGVKNLTVTYSENDIKPSERVDYTTAGTDNTTVAEDGVLLNINRQNFLTMDVNGTKTLKAYRAWELVQSYLNCIITPDFHYTIISGDDVVSLTDKDSPSAGDGDWKTLTALKEGTAIIEVTYDALQLEGGDYDGVYGASDPARTGLMVVQVGGKVADVDFGIQGKSSQSTSTSAMTYNSSYAKPWDAEFDTLYFTGSSGQLKLSPKVTGGTVSKVEVSADKGKTWTTLTAEAGVYTADIVSGNNIIKVTADTGVSYQIVRGDKISVKYIEVTDAATNPADGDGIIEAGETIRIKFNGIHQPIPKISGNYNPGYPSNDGGDMKIRLKYTFNNEAIKTENPLWQYNFITAGNYIDVVVPDGEETSYTLSDGYISVGVLGLPDFANDGADSHRNIPDDGCNTRGGKGDPTYNTRSMLPDLTITVGRATDTNTPPVVKPNAIKTKSIELGENFVINPETLFDDADGNTLAFTVSINGGDLQSADASFKYTPAAVGTYTINFTASDGKDQTEHTITLTVTEAPKEEEKKDDFGLLPKEIAGYVTISFEDNATRKAGEKGLKFPTALGTIVPTTKVPYKAGESIADVTLRLLDNCGIGYKTTYGQYGFYLSKIKNFKVGNTRYEEMGEFDAGNGSGWMITHNNVFIGQSAGNVKVNNNDRIEWKFTCQLGADIGDPFFADEKKEEVKDVTTSGGAASPGETVTTTTPTEVKVIGTTATATITKENVTEVIKQAAEHKAEEIVVQVTETDTKGAANVKVQLDTTTVKDVVNKTAASLTVKTENGSVTLDRETLKTVAAEAAGSTVTLEVTEVAKPTEAHKAAAGENGHVIQLTIKSGNKTISVFNQGKATVTVEIPTKLGGKKVAAIHIGDDGVVEHLKGQEVTVNGKKHYRFDTSHFSTFALVDAEEIGLEVEEVPALTDEDAKALVKELSFSARSAKVKKGIKVTLKLGAADKAIIEELEAEGYTVKYKFYRSTKKSSKYQSKVTTKKTTYTNTAGKTGTKYYYKAIAQVYNAEGKLVAETALKQCKYASRTWK